MTSLAKFSEVRKRVPRIIFLYWVIKIASTTLGETGADMFSMTFDLGYGMTIVIFMSLFLLLLGIKLYIQRYDPLTALLLVTLALWYTKERSLSVGNITTPAAELYYWTAFLIANTLGTAAGDYLADGLGLGFMLSAELISGVLALVDLAHFYTKLPGVLLFWLAFVLTRPFGASLFFALVLALALIKETKLERARR